MRLFFGNAVRHHIGCSTQPSKNFIVKSLYIVIGSIIEKILFYILDYIFYLALALWICFATKVKGKGLVPGIAAKAFGENDISPVFTYYKYFVLVIDNFVRNSSYIFKSLFMGYYGQFRGEIPICEPNIFKTGTGKDHRKEKHLYPMAGTTAHIVFTKINLCLFSIRHLFNHLKLAVLHNIGQVMFDPDPLDKIEYCLWGYLGKVYIIFL